MSYRVCLVSIFLSLVCLALLLGCQAGKSFVNGISNEPVQEEPSPADEAAHDLGKQTKEVLENSGPYGNLLLAGITAATAFVARRENKKRKASEFRRRQVADELEELADDNSEESPVGTIWLDSEAKVSRLLKKLNPEKV